jgi:hypothetical protein
MICKMIYQGGAPECWVGRKVNNNRLLEEENLAFIGCGVDDVVDVDADIVELLL